jgi:glucosamine-6-phosphate deaminase
MDEYLGLPTDAPQRFGTWLKRAIFERLPFGAVHLIEPDDDPEATADAYAAKLAEAPIDIVCCGIGANSHLAFNDPPADFNDAKAVKRVELDDTCRQQQVDDECFASLDKVPTHALTLTIPRLLAAERIFCCVPGPLKRAAVKRTLEGPIDGKCPASALRLHTNWRLYLDHESAVGLGPPEWP